MHPLCVEGMWGYSPSETKSEKKKHGCGPDLSKMWSRRRRHIGGLLPDLVYGHNFWTVMGHLVPKKPMDLLK